MAALRRAEAHPIDACAWRSWQVVGPLSSWDPSTVLGLFTYDPTDAPHYRELDFEFSRWGNVRGRCGAM